MQERLEHEPSVDLAALRDVLEEVQDQLLRERASNRRYRDAIEGHLLRGCPSRALRAVLAEERSSR